MSTAQTVRNAVPKVLAAGAATAGLGWLMHLMPADTPGREWWPWLLLAGVVTFVAPMVVWLVRRTGSAGQVRRWSGRSRRNDGVASAWTILRVASWLAMRRRARVLRPSLARRNVLERLLVSTRAYATRIARVGLLGVWSAVEDVTLRIGGPRTGKTGELACRILDAPGAVIATSTRTDLIELTAGLRSKVGPVEVFNPSGLGGLASTVIFDPLSGCAAPSTATARATDLLAGVSAPGNGGDRAFWSSQARRVLAALMHA
ncbi:MAG: type IV secretory system conjugative DNA transfer family protein, partial [Micromonosporaceae bacterium]